MWLLLSVFAYAASNSCSVFNCGSAIPTSDTCETFSSSTGTNTYTVTPCESQLICPFVYQGASDCQYPTYYSKLPGDYCNANYTCHSDNCNLDTNTCTGSSTGCGTSADCNPGFFCNSSSICQAQIPAGEACDNHTEECENIAICDVTVCVELFSLDNGNETFTLFKQGLAPACKSGFAAKNSTGDLICEEAPKSNETGLMPCPENETVCIASDNVTSKPCACGFNGNEYCPLFEGDEPVVAMIQSWIALMPYSSKCSTVNRLSNDCYLAQGDAAWKAYLNFQVNASLYFNRTWIFSQTSPPVCVNQTFMKPYYNILAAQQGSTQSCPAYTCTTYTEGWEDDQCIFNDVSVIYSQLTTNNLIKPCSVGDICTSNSVGLNWTCFPAETPSRNPGEFCNSTLPCKVGSSCVSSYCNGYTAGHPCDLHNPLCKEGLYCDASSICTPYLANGEACNINTECQTYSVCGLGKCILKYSLSDGDPTEIYNSPNPNPGYGYSELCSSGWAYTNATLAIVCGDAPQSPSTGAIPCIEGPCKDSTNTYSKNCTCGFGASYCPSFEGDYFLKNAITNYKKLQDFNRSCYQDGAKSSCFDFDRTYLSTYFYFNTNITLYQYYPEYQDQSTCIKATITVWADYWAEVAYINSTIPKKKKSSAYSLSFSILLLLAFNA